MAIECIRRKNIELTPEKAEHYLGFNDYDSQRPIRLSHVEYLKDKMEKGLFRFGEVAFASKNGDQEKMMNGQHVCHAVIEHGKPVEAVLERFKCDTDLDMSELFQQFEILVRSLQDFVRHEKNALKLDWPLRVASVVVSAAAIDQLRQPSFSSHAAGASTKNRRAFLSTKDKKAQLLRKYIKEGSFINNICSGGSFVSHILKAPVAFLMMETWRVRADDAHKFWCSVRDGEMLKRKDPEMVYRNFLMEASARVIGKRYRAVSNHEFIYKGHLAWNAFRRGTTTQLAYRQNFDPPKLV